MKKNIIKLIKYRNKSFKKDILLLLLLSIFFIAFFVIDLSSSNNQKEPFTENSNDVTITAIGDVMTSRYLSNYDIDYLFENAQQSWVDSDIVVANIEQSVIKDFESEYVTSNKKINFGVDEEHFLEFKDSGINLFSFANNHVGDYGIKGIRELLSILDANNLNSVGVYKNTNYIDELYYSENINDTNIAIVSINSVLNYKKLGGNIIVSDYTPGVLSNLDKELIHDIIEDANSKNEVVIVYMHWGSEYSKAIDKEQKELADYLTGLGIDLIIGSHTHILQPVEIVNGIPVVYSLGNFVFDQVLGTTSLTVSLDIGINNQQITSLKFNPFVIKNGKPFYSRKSFENKKIKRMLGKSLGKRFEDLDDGSFYLPID